MPLCSVLLELLVSRLWALRETMPLPHRRGHQRLGDSLGWTLGHEHLEALPLLLGMRLQPISICYWASQLFIRPLALIDLVSLKAFIAPWGRGLSLLMLSPALRWVTSSPEVMSTELPPCLQGWRQKWKTLTQRWELPLIVYKTKCFIKFSIPLLLPTIIMDVCK